MAWLHLRRSAPELAECASQPDGWLPAHLGDGGGALLSCSLVCMCKGLACGSPPGAAELWSCQICPGSFQATTFTLTSGGPPPTQGRARLSLAS